MFCSSCGKEIADGVRFCPACGAAVDNQTGGTVSMPEQQKVQEKGIFVEGDMDTLRQIAERENKGVKRCKNIGIALAVIYLLISLSCEFTLAVLSSASIGELSSSEVSSSIFIRAS